MQADELLAAFAVFGAVFAAASGGDSPRDIRRQYARRPGMPPAWVFEVAWGALYLCIAASAYLFWFGRAAGWASTAGTWALLANLLANRYWTRLYFTYKSVPLAVLDILLLLATGAFYMFCALWHMWNVYYFLAALLFAPYMAWLCFALYLVWRAEQ